MSSLKIIKKQMKDASKGGNKQREEQRKTFKTECLDPLSKIQGELTEAEGALKINGNLIKRTEDLLGIGGGLSLDSETFTGEITDGTRPEDIWQEDQKEQRKAQEKPNFQPNVKPPERIKPSGPSQDSGTQDSGISGKR